ncbi:MAG: uracil-DNA glycosylase family protein [Ktedonobacteraceae bacterium]
MRDNQEADRTGQLIVLQDHIRTCRLCEQHGYIPSAHPIVSGSVHDRVMVIGQAPGHLSIAKDRPFSGPGGRVLQNWLEIAGFPAGYLHAHAYLSSLTRCDPGRNPRGGGDRKPSPPELTLCRPYLDAELAIVHPQVVLLVGGMAIETFFGKCTLEQIIGTYQERNGMLFLPLPHPSGVSRWLNNSEHKKLHQLALNILASWREIYDL